MSLCLIELIVIQDLKSYGMSKTTFLKINYIKPQIRLKKILIFIIKENKP